MDKIDTSAAAEILRAENAMLRECVANLEGLQERDAKEIELLQGQLEAMRAERDEWRQTAMNKLDVSNSTALQAMRAERDAAMARFEKACHDWEVGGLLWADRCATLASRVAELEKSIRFALAAGMTELNLGNYDHDDVCALQNEAIEIHSILTAALAKDGGE